MPAGFPGDVFAGFFRVCREQTAPQICILIALTDGWPLRSSTSGRRRFSAGAAVFRSRSSEAEPAERGRPRNRRFERAKDRVRLERLDGHRQCWRTCRGPSAPPADHLLAKLHVKVAGRRRTWHVVTPRMAFRGPSGGRRVEPPTLNAAYDSIARALHLAGPQADHRVNPRSLGRNEEALSVRRRRRTPVSSPEERATSAFRVRANGRLKHEFGDRCRVRVHKVDDRHDRVTTASQPMRPSALVRLVSFAITVAARLDNGAAKRRPRFSNRRPPGRPGSPSKSANCRATWSLPWVFMRRSDRSEVLQRLYREIIGTRMFIRLMGESALCRRGAGDVCSDRCTAMTIGRCPRPCPWRSYGDALGPCRQLAGALGSVRLSPRHHQGRCHGARSSRPPRQPGRFSAGSALRALAIAPFSTSNACRVLAARAPSACARAVGSVPSASARRLLPGLPEFAESGRHPREMIARTWPSDATEHISHARRLPRGRISRSSGSRTAAQAAVPQTRSCEGPGERP